MQPEIVITGLGVTTPVGHGRRAFAESLLAGRSSFGVMNRPGRQAADTRFLGAELAAFDVAEDVPASVLRSASLSAQAAVAALGEAWRDAGLQDVDPLRIGLVVGGSNLQQRETWLMQQRYADKLKFLRPSYGLACFDTDICGLCTSVFGMRGAARTVGGASASGQLAVIEAAESVLSGRLDVCIAIGALMDLSVWECQAFRAMGAMGSSRFAEAPAEACRPFDADRDGFIYGENCAAVVVERSGRRHPSRGAPHARLAGWAVVMDANRNPDPSVEGELAAMSRALDRAGMTARDIDYVNPHGSGSGAGDTAELQALAACGLRHAAINATKSITGHGLSAAGAVEIVATALQFEADALHPTLNLERCIDPGFDWVTRRRDGAGVRTALNLSHGFGGINTAVVMTRP